jgi:hypothetical protein
LTWANPRLEAKIKVSKNKEQFFYQIASTVVGKGYKGYYKDKNEKGVIVIKAKAVDALMIEAKFDFYSKAYDKELDIFYQDGIELSYDGILIKPPFEPEDFENIREVYAD